MRRIMLVLLMMAGSGRLAAQATVAERTDGRRTASHAEVLAFLDSLQERGAGLRVGVLGYSPEGRMLPYVIAARPMVADPGAAHRSGKPIVYIEANIHAGEVEGKAALQEILRELTLGSLRPLLDSVIVLAVPIYNADGNDAWGPGERNRPAQDGPDTVGLRPNGQGLDLNRDYVKQEAPETRASLAFVTRWDPDVWIDLHTTDGSYHGYDLTWSPGLNPNQTPANSWVQDTVLEQIRATLRGKGVPTFPYGNFRDQRPDSLTKGWVTYEPYPRYGSNLMGMSRISILSEAYSHDPFLERIASTRAFVTEILHYLAGHANQVKRHLDETIAWRPDSVIVRSTFAPPRTDTVVAEITRSAGRGAGMYSPREPTGEFRTLVMPVIDRFVGTRREAIPVAYLLDPQWKAVVELLRRQGVVVERLDQGWRGTMGHFRIDSVDVERQFQGHRLVSVAGSWEPASSDSVPAGSFLIPTDQRLGMLAAYLLEPASEDGYTTWNFFDRGIRRRGIHPVRRIDRLPPVARTLVP